MLTSIAETRPPIILTTVDRNQLTALVAAFPPGSEAASFLGEEIARAEVLRPAEIGPGVATMHSYVEFIDDVAGRIERATLVYPGEEDQRLGRISVLSPTGTALLGLCEGQSIYWRGESGRCGITLLKVLVQHWRAPPSSWSELGRLTRMRASPAGQRPAAVINENDNRRRPPEAEAERGGTPPAAADDRGAVPLTPRVRPAPPPPDDDPGPQAA